MKPAEFRPTPRTEPAKRRQVDERLGARVAQLAWFELAAAATRRALAQQELALSDERLAAGD